MHLPSERKVEADLGGAKNHATTVHCHSVFMHCDYRGLMLVSLVFVKGCADIMQTEQRRLLLTRPLSCVTVLSNKSALRLICMNARITPLLRSPSVAQQ
jgi:hypothetical protein